jgi:hypothetical protein
MLVSANVAVVAGRVIVAPVTVAEVIRFSASQTKLSVPRAVWLP